MSRVAAVTTKALVTTVARERNGDVPAGCGTEQIGGQGRRIGERLIELLHHLRKQVQVGSDVDLTMPGSEILRHLGCVLCFIDSVPSTATRAVAAESHSNRQCLARDGTLHVRDHERRVHTAGEEGT